MASSFPLCGGTREAQLSLGANTCIANRYSGKPIRCMHNPELKTPGKTLQPAMPARRIAVVGAGPAGLEAARLCAVRGHQVTVYEASHAPGGQLGYWARSTSMKELDRIIQWREAELARLGVAIEFGTEITADNLSDVQADTLIMAIGATEVLRDIPGCSDAVVVTPTQLLDLPATSAKRAIVLSDGRGQAGLISAEWLLERGVEVEVITEDIAVANDLDPTNRNAWYERLGRQRAVLTPQTVVEHIHGNVVHTRHLFSQASVVRESIDLIVDWNGCEARKPIVQSATGKTAVHAIGDCVSPRNVEVAMAEALALAESI